MENCPPLLEALQHVRQKAPAVRDCRNLCLASDPAAASALTGVLCETLEHAGMLERALYGAGVSPSLTRRAAIPSNRDAAPRALLSALAQEERLALVRQVARLRDVRGENENRLLLFITREQAVHLRLFQTLAGRF